MRVLPILLSVALHVAVIAFGVLYQPSPNLHVDLRKKVYTVDLVQLKPAVGKKVAQPAPPAPTVSPDPKPESAAKQASAPAPPEPVVPAPEPRPKTIVATAKKIPEPTPVKKISPKKRPETPKKKPAQTKPAPNVPPQKKPPTKPKSPPKPKPPVKKTPRQLSAEEIMAAALGDAKKKASSSAKPNGASAQDVLSRELASLQKTVGSSAGTGSAAGGAGAVVEEIFGTLVEGQVKEHWRFPRLGNLGLAAVVEIVVDPAGQVISKRVLTSSGRSDFDASCLRAVEEAGTLPDPPERKRWTVRITFNLAEQG